MMDVAAFTKLVKSAGILDNVVEAETPALLKGGLVFSVLGEVNINNKQLKLCISASSRFPLHAPVIYFINHNEYDRIPHVQGDGLICYAQEDAIVLDIDNPIGVIRECLKMAISTVADGFAKKNEGDFYNEYETYWRRLKDAIPILTVIPIDDHIKVIHYLKIPNRDIMFAWSSEIDGEKILNRLITNQNKQIRHYYGVFIPLQKGAKIYIPKDDEELDINHIREITLTNLSPENKKRLEIIQATGKIEDLLIYCLPQPNDHHSLFGVRVKNIAFGKHPLFSSGRKFSLIPLTVQRIDKEHMLTRAGTGRKYLDKRILVIGGGSVGGYLCDELIKSAIVNVDIVDGDSLIPDNCYRHTCGIKYVLMNKAEAIKSKLETFYPHANINAINTNFETAFEDGKLKLNKYDTIIVATGNATLNQYLNRLFRVEASKTPVIYCWLDPLGIGGHCLITNITQYGCFQCLYTNEDLHNIASFTNKEQPKSFSKSITGCGAAYIPYGSLDAIQTAIIVVRNLLRIFEGEVAQNCVESWKGNADLFLSEGYKLASRYFQSIEELERSKHLFYQPNCTICGRQRTDLQTE
ncbi:hypothetical protein A4D02_34725 [Niastella koreensis]|uniref:UBA/THIF-type NAD/FAD binding protein n=2 Tax=Niastella koreensis TaxID=354356 RepID=G8T7H7_NIAKG|nr:ThiF family adenylyltransferase [Niastella koreensis]AEW02232.1 UBA/THIF-type NAD/FAD binding protein [Niastella koreensis GR20-10]OQP45106.1 hypothetical protein A4D02_34725 [Niastella koreensis]